MTTSFPSKAIDVTFNVLGYIPVVSSFSGAGRQLYGVIKAIAGIAIAIIVALGAGTAMPGIASHLLLSGCLHIIRGQVEKYPFIGNLACISVHDKKKFIGNS